MAEQVGEARKDWDDISKKAVTLKNLQEAAQAAREMGASEDRVKRYATLLDRVMDDMEEELFMKEEKDKPEEPEEKH